MSLPLTQHPTREVLIDAALTLFASDGYRGTTIRKIEATAGLTPGAGGLYRHFRSKEELLLAAVARYRADVAQFLAKAPQVMELGDVRAELLVDARLSREFNERNNALLRVLLLEQRAIPKKAQLAFEAAWESAYRMHAHWLATRLGPDSGIDVEAAAIQLYGSLAHHQIQNETFSRPPLGVDLDRFTVAWADHWTAFIQAFPPRKARAVRGSSTGSRPAK